LTDALDFGKIEFPEPKGCDCNGPVRPYYLVDISVAPRFGFEVDVEHITYQMQASAPEISLFSVSGYFS
jgi:hypothetical protein